MIVVDGHDKRLSSQQSVTDRQFVAPRAESNLNRANSGNFMKIITTIDDLEQTVSAARRAGRRIGVVPTMGALHEGHLSLVDRAASLADFVIVTIFVNPTQFAPHEDLAKYPRTFADDCRQLTGRCVDVVFSPSAAEIYPPGFSTYVEPPAVSRAWEGAARPTHFRGVATIVLKLLNMTQADVAVFGQKDFQQVAVIRRMLVDFNHSCRIDVAPIVREPDGLAMSSRNCYLSVDERERAVGIRRGLLKAREAVLGTAALSGQDVAQIMREEMHAHGIAEVDYAVAADPQSLEELDTIRLPVVLLVAARVGATRLIDNEWIQARP